MPLFVAVHKWKKENFVIVTKKVLKVLGNLLEGVSLCSSYVYDTGAWCVYTAESSEAGGQIKAFLAQVPEMGTEVVPVLQFYPPSPDIYAMIYNLLEITTK